MSFTVSQRVKGYLPLRQRAFAVHCQENGLNPAVDGLFETWMRDQLMEATGYPSSKFCNTIEDYDCTMLHLATIAHDEVAISYFSAAAERRLRHLINKSLASLSSLQSLKCDWNYARAIHVHMNLPLTMEECPALLLRKVLQALNTHVNRLRREKMNRMRGAA